MFRIVLGSIMVFGLLTATATRAADSQKTTSSKASNQTQATIDRVDSQNDKITVQTMDKQGKSSEKTLDISKNVDVRDIHGNAAKLSDLKSNDPVCLTERDGKVTKIAEQNAAVITNVDAKNGTVKVHMKDETGKDVDRVFHITENAEFVDSNGDVASLDVFRAGDQVLFVEEQGKIRGLNKSTPRTANLTQRKGQTTEKR